MKQGHDLDDERAAEEAYATLRDLARAAMRQFDKLPAAERARLRREQAIDFAWGQLACMRGGPKLTREDIGRIYDKQREGEAPAEPEGALVVTLADEAEYGRDR